MNNNKRMCYTVLHTEYVENEGFRAVIVTEGESGYRLTGTWPCRPHDVQPYFWGHGYEKALEIAKGQNRKMGLSDDDVNEIILSSMLANP